MHFFLPLIPPGDSGTAFLKKRKIFQEFSGDTTEQEALNSSELNRNQNEINATYKDK